MNIDFELIEKYHLGLCSEQEKKEVECWMHSEELGNIPANISFSKEEKKDLKDELWKQIILDEKTKHRFNYRNYIWYAAAVCVLFVLIYSGYSNQNYSTVKSLAYSGSKTIMFSQSMEFKAQSDRSLTFFNTMDESADLGSATIQAVKGETYWVSKINFRGKDEVFVVNKKDINELPTEIRVELMRSIKG